MSRRRATVAAVVTVALLGAGCGMSRADAPALRTPALAQPLPAPTLPAPAPQWRQAVDEAEPVAEPVSEPVTESVTVPSPPRRIVAPTIEVDAPVIDLGLTPDGSLETPTDFDDAGWWAGGTRADEPGPTVIVGHVDDRSGPAVFFRLSELEPGDPIVVIDDRGREFAFEVVDKGLYAKDSFPTERVYGNDGESTLRLVTCGGDFDRSERSYESNWVVYAVAA